MSNDTRIAVDVAKAVFELAISDRDGHVASGNTGDEICSWPAWRTSRRRPWSWKRADPLTLGA